MNEEEKKVKKDIVCRIRTCMFGIYGAKFAYNAQLSSQHLGWDMSVDRNMTHSFDLSTSLHEPDIKLGEKITQYRIRDQWNILSQAELTM